MPTAISTTFGFFHIRASSAGFFGELLNTETLGGPTERVNQASAPPSGYTPFGIANKQA
jgi:hypothetical protein